MAVVFLFLAALFFVLGALSATGRLPRNGLAGMRTRATMASDAAWIAAHRASAWSVGVVGLICVAAAASKQTSWRDEPRASSAAARLARPATHRGHRERRGSVTADSKRP